MKLKILSLVAAGAITGAALAQEVNTAALSQNGWYSDDTRADGTGSNPAGTNLKSPTLTDMPEAGSGTPAHDADILAQIIFGQALGTVPALTHGGAVHLKIGPSGSGKSQISHRKDDASGHGPGSGFGLGFLAEYSWMGNGTSSVTASLKFGIKTAEFGSTPVSTRTGENVWDKVLVYEPGNLNGGTSDGLWHTESLSHTSGKWWFFDRTANVSMIGTPLTLADMATSAVIVSGDKTIADVYDLITASGAIITSVQFGIGSGNAGGSVYVNQLETNVYRDGMLTTFGTPSPYDQNVTPDAIFGGGNANGSYTVDRSNGVELGMRGKLRWPPSNIFNSNGDGTYTFSTGSGTSTPPEAEWAFEWSINTNWNGWSSWLLDDLTYQIGMDFDPGLGTNFLAFDPITVGEVIPFMPPPPAVVFWDHSIGTNATLNGEGIEATNGPDYEDYLAANNVAQNSWRMTFFDVAPFTFNPAVPGRYDFYLAAYDGATEVARTEIAVLAMDGVTLSLEADTCQTDQDPGTSGVQIEVEVWLRNPDDVDVTGWQAFLAFNDTAMDYVGASSSYSATPFPIHIQPIATANVTTGQIRLDGNAFTAHDGDALLATLVFTVSECVSSAVTFDLTQPFDSEASFGGTALITDLLNATGIVADDTDPVIADNADITQPADAGSCTQAVVTFTAPAATDACDSSPTVVCSPPSGSIFPVGPPTIVTCTATDECGNTSSSTFTVTITPYNAVDVVVHLTGSDAETRCIRFVTDDCDFYADVEVTFSGSSPAVASTTIQVPCGVWTSLCAKDQQHTKWDTSPLMISGAKYVAMPTLVLDPGDTDNDGDVDINDVTLFISQFGDVLDPSSECPWDGTRDADFSNNGAVAGEDYSLLSDQWLKTSSCDCTMMQEGEDFVSLEHSTPVRDARTRAADLNRDGRVDVRDVEIFEQRHGFPGDLSRRMRETAGGIGHHPRP